MMKSALSAVLLAAAGVLAACESVQSGPTGSSKYACRYDRMNNTLVQITEDVGRGISPALIRERLRTNAGRLAELATGAGNVDVGTPALSEIACRRTAVLALTALSYLPEREESARAERRRQSEMGTRNCVTLSASVRSRGSANACDLFQIYQGLYWAQVEASAVLAVSNRPPTVQGLDEVRQRIESFVFLAYEARAGSERAIPTTGPYAAVARAEMLSASCTLNAGAQVLAQAQGDSAVRIAAQRVGVAHMEARRAALGWLGMTEPQFNAECAAWIRGPEPSS